MLQGVFLISKQMISYLWLCLLMMCGCAPSDSTCKGGEIITAPDRVVRECLGAYLDYVKDVKAKVKLAQGIGKIPLFGKSITLLGASLGGHTSKDLENSAITARFFSSGRAMQIARDIGSQEDLAYMASVYKEFFEGSSHSFDQLVHIMHLRMMEALGYRSSTTIAQFRKVMDEKNKAGRYKYVHGAQFDTYARLIALNLFITYWYDTHVA